jgi:hypothetical protein
MAVSGERPSTDDYKLLPEGRGVEPVVRSVVTKPKPALGGGFRRLWAPPSFSAQDRSRPLEIRRDWRATGARSLPGRDEVGLAEPRPSRATLIE